MTSTKNKASKNVYDEIIVGSGNIASIPQKSNYKNGLSFGFAFDIKALKSLELTELMFYTRQPEAEVPEGMEFEIYTVQGGFMNNMDGIMSWSSLASGKTTNDTTIVNLDNTVLVSEGRKQGIYITLKTKNLLFSSTESNLLNKVGDRFEENAAVALLIGAAVTTYPLSNNLVKPRLWRGHLSYKILDVVTVSPSISPSATPTIITGSPSIAPTLVSKSPSISPSSYPSLVPSSHPSLVPSEVTQRLSTNLTFTFFGSNLDFMDSDSDTGFCDEVQRYLNRIMTPKHADLNVTSVKTHTEQLFGIKYNEVSIIINADYHSPLYIDFPPIVHSSMFQFKYSLLETLHSSNEYFLAVDKITSVITPEKFYNYQVEESKLMISFYGKNVTQIDDKHINEYEDVIYFFLVKALAKNFPTTLIINVQTTNQIYSNKNSFPYLDTWLYVQSKNLPPPYFDLFLELESLLELGNKDLEQSILDSSVPLNFEYLDAGSRPLGFDLEIFSASGELESETSFFTSIFGVLGMVAGGVVVLGTFFTVLYYSCGLNKKKDDAKNREQAMEQMCAQTMYSYR